ncbi:TetR/AcrR family transcriptional regulator [Streptomyces collinus]|uniref:TetR/AcrR family transcriptional regulator n=1 Tax=Streptomyces collinus TaxID=42684 RepID=UPI0036763D16
MHRQSGLEARACTQVRRTPVQARSQRTVERILHAATDILTESGLLGLNTNAVAARAGINVATLYSYFPDKVAIVRELADRLDARRDRLLAEQMTTLASTEEWRPFIADAVESLVRLRVENPESAILYRALRAVPETNSLNSAASRRRAHLISLAIIHRNQEMDKDRAEMIGLVVSELVARMLDLAFESDPYDCAIIRETISLVQRYLAPAFDGITSMSGD